MLYRFILLLLPLFAFSQTHRFVYEMKHKPDSTKSYLKHDEVVLDITGDEVNFYEHQALRTDSINAIGRGRSWHGAPLSKLRRKPGSSDNINYDIINADYYAYKTTDPLPWQILPETKTVGPCTAQKAAADFHGRRWTAWFAKDIPFNEGPYKFNGLPGLIVELYDDGGNFNFKLQRIEKPAKVNTEIVETVFGNKPLEISEEKFRQMKLAYYNDPYASYRAMKPGTWAIMLDDEREIDTVEGLNSATRVTQAELRKNNNPIELDKAIRYPEK
ncbi:MAG: GLPGLI family protein [Chryseobacterium sp.]|nr:MAG: GLPGLI family protein [Chryseobacterium sp.]